MKTYKEDLQKKICGLKDLDYEQRLKTLKLPSLEYRRIRGDLIEIYKMVTGLYDKETTWTLFTVMPQSNTRGHPYKLVKPYVKTAKFAHFFTNRIINIWNDLPDRVVLAGTVNSYKNRIDTLFHEFIYNIHLELI